MARIEHFHRFTEELCDVGYPEWGEITDGRVQDRRRFINSRAPINTTIT
jgi:hypothetical protein